MKTNHQKLSDLEQKVFHEGGTEKPFSGEYWNHHQKGIYACKSCGKILFDSSKKLDSSKGPMGLQGWPAFEQAIEGSIVYKEDKSLGMKRTEALCAHCGIHLGHVFDDVEGEGTRHFCVNSCSLDFEKK